MNVLYISDGSDKFGAPKALIEMLKEIKENNCNITPIVLTSKYNNVNKFCDENNIQNYVTNHPTFMMTKKEKFIKFAIKFVIKYLRYTVFSKIAIHKVKKLVNLDEIDLIHTNTTVINLGAELSKKYKIKHIWHIREFGQQDYDFISFKYNYIKYMNKNTDKFLAISNAVKECWIEKGIDKEKIELVYDGIDLSDIKFSNKNINNFEKINIVFSGYISESKGQIQAVRAFSKLPKESLQKIHLDIIGTGKEDYLKVLKDEVQKYKLEDNISLLGYKKELRSLLNNYQVGLMCSKSEGFGRTTAEYMAAGIVVIATNTGANLELIDNNINGIIYKYNDIEDLKDKIQYIIDNQQITSNIALKAHEKVLKKFNMKINVKVIVDIYSRIEE